MKTKEIFFVPYLILEFKYFHDFMADFNKKIKLSYNLLKMCN